MEEKYTNFWGDGKYKCRKCGSPLFDSGSKFKSGTMWPSFRNVISENSVETVPNDSYGNRAKEVLCASCGEHLGHVFNDGKALGDEHPDAGARYCILSDTLLFQGEDDV